MTQENTAILNYNEFAAQMWLLKTLCVVLTESKLLFKHAVYIGTY